MRQLADRVLLSKSGVTRLVDRLVADGLVERDTCLSDARGAEAVLTEVGLGRLRRASRTHLRGIDEHFLAAVDPNDLSVIQRSMLAVAEGVGPGGDDDRCQSMAAAIRFASDDGTTDASNGHDADG
jgi:DNA-binding MarR family transcriptional regulator